MEDSLGSLQTDDGRQKKLLASSEDIEEEAATLEEEIQTLITTCSEPQSPKQGKKVGTFQKVENVS